MEPGCKRICLALLLLLGSCGKQIFTLTVTKKSIAGATGAVTGGGIACGVNCSVSAPAGTTVTLTSAAPTFQSFSVECPGSGCKRVTSSTVSIEMAGDRRVVATFRPAVNYVFVTSTRHNGNLGGLAGADAICTTSAAVAGLNGTYVAWLAASTASAVSRLGNARGWMRADGLPFGDSVSTLLGSRQVFYPPSVDEYGRDAALRTGAPGGLNYAWTGTDGAGSAVTDGTLCGDWSSTSIDDHGRIGYPGRAVTWNWANSITACANPDPSLYCFETTYQNPVAPPPLPQGARIAFLSSPWAPSGGLSNADAHCAADAAAAHLQGTFRALMADVGKAPFDPTRFDTSRAPWYRPDGVQVVAQASDALRPHGPELLAPVTVLADAQYAEPFPGLAWVGFGGQDGDLTVPGTAATTCSGWTSNASSDHATMGDWDSVLMYWGPVTCDGTWRVQCLQL